MLDQILWFDALLKLIAGVLLILSPKVVAAAFGVPRADNGFYARLLGAVLVGIALAIIVEGAAGRPAGLGPGGAAAVNICGGLMLFVLTMFGRSDMNFRGRMLVWLILAALALLTIAEYAYS